MSIKKRIYTTRLPQALREEIDSYLPSVSSKKLRYPKASRKEARKQARASRKKNKVEFFSTKLHSNKRIAEEDLIESPSRKKAKRSDSVSRGSTYTNPVSCNAPSSVPPVQVSTVDGGSSGRLARSSSTTRIAAIKTRGEEEEDLYIAYLESKLGYRNGRKKPVEDDGLEDLFNLASFTTIKQQTSMDIPTNSPRSKKASQVESRAGELDYDSLVEDLSFRDSIDEEWPGISEELIEGYQKPDIPVDSQEDTRYIPPHSRDVHHTKDGDAEAMVKVSKQIKGLLNRMSEQNMATIVDGLEEIYRNHRRNDVSTTLTTLIINNVASHSSLLDSYVVLHAVIVSSLYKIIGIEFAAHFVQSVISLYEQHYVASQKVSQIDNAQVSPDIDSEGKECLNLIMLLSELYNFQVVSSVLIFDIIRSLLDKGLTELDVELLLKMMKNSGQQLRQDDPSVLKDIIQIVHNKALDMDDELSSRARFMIETLINLKNNKLRRNAALSQGAVVVERMKKFLVSLAKRRHAHVQEPLRVSLEDLHSARTKGKWWLVGAAWGGDPLVERQAEPQVVESVKTMGPAGDLSKLARKQGMNTDIRRSIFVVLMSSDDYVDACERLSQLNLTEVQQREIVRVLLHCCGNENSYNPYYALVCQHLCRTSHSYKITLQFCLWDFIRDLGEQSVGGAELIKNLKNGDDFDIKNISASRMSNVAKAYAWWIAKDCITFTVLKPVDFTGLKPQTRAFLRELIVQIFITSQQKTPTVISKHIPTTWNRDAVEQIFIKATRIQTLAMGLAYFISEEFRDLSSEEEGVAKLIKWASELCQNTLQGGVGSTQI